jgi:hypothetical protein
LCPTGRYSRRSDFFDPSIAHMNAIVLIALKRSYTFVVLGILIAIFGGLVARRTPTDIFTNIRIPVVAWSGLTRV